MAAEKYNPYGGSQSLSEIFLCVDDVIVKTGGTTAADANADKLLSLILTSENEVSYNDDGTVNIIPTNYQADPVLRTFFNTYVKTTTSGNLAEVTLDNGTKIGGGSSTKFVWVFYGDIVNDGANDLIQIAIVKGKFSAKSGGFKTKRGEYNGFTIEFNGEVVSKVGGMTIPVALLASTIVDVTATGDADTKLATIAKDSSSIIDYVKIAA